MALRKALLEEEEDPWAVEKPKYNDSSEDDEKWNMEDDSSPLLNVFTFGWMEDGRLGYAPDKETFIQNTPRPVAKLRAKPLPAASARTARGADRSQFVAKSVAAGSRHSVFMMINVRHDKTQATEDGGDGGGAEAADTEDDDGEPVKKKRTKKIYSTGLTQVALCEEAGYNTPVQIEWNDEMERVDSVAAGRGTTFIVGRQGSVYSYGHGKFGVLGHGNCESLLTPRRVRSLSRERITSVSAGGGHAMAMTSDGTLYSWGKNDKGQCGRGVDGIQSLTPSLVTFPSIGTGKHQVLQHDCGRDHSLALVRVWSRGGVPANLIYAWGAHEKGQLGSGDEQGRNLPQENRWMTRFLSKEGISVGFIAAGGYHNLALVEGSGQVVSWGGNDYGQLGHGNQWDDGRPKLINKLKDVKTIAAGLRHSMAVVEGLTMEVMSWGYNGLVVEETVVIVYLNEGPVRKALMRSTNRQIAGLHDVAHSVRILTVCCFLCTVVATTNLNLKPPLQPTTGTESSEWATITCVCSPPSSRR